MTIAVCGSGIEANPLIEKKAEDIGKEIAKNKHILITGGCRGYPYAALKGALSEKGKAISYSPAKDKAEHITKYNFPIEKDVEYIFTGLGIPERNIPLVKAADAVILIGGQIGTLNEFTLAFHEKKKIGVLEGSGGITELIPKISEICEKSNETDIVIYEKDPKKLVKRLT